MMKWIPPNSRYRPGYSCYGPEPRNRNCLLSFMECDGNRYYDHQRPLVEGILHTTRNGRVYLVQCLFSSFSFQQSPLSNFINCISLVTANHIMRYMLLGLAIAAVASAATSESPTLTPGATCTGSAAYCAGTGTNIILRCDEGKLYAGNCIDNTGEPSQGALCNSFAANTATCSVIGSSETTSSSSVSTTSSSSVTVPLPSASCSGDVQYCAGENTNIILRCEDGVIIPGNCNDNTGEPTQGALCNSYAPSHATCSVVGSGSNSTTSVISYSTTIGPITTTTVATSTPTSNITVSVISPSAPVQTGAAAVKGLSWSDAILAFIVAGAGLGL